MKVFHAAQISIEPPIRSAPNVDHGSRRIEEVRLSNVVPRFLLLDGTHDVGAQFLVVRTCAQTSIEVMFNLREQAGANLAVRCKPHAAARTAEGLAHGRDNSNLANAIFKGVAARRFAGFARWHLHKRQDTPDALDDFLQRYHDLRRPQPPFFKGHELDEPHHDVLFTRKPRESLDLVVVEAAEKYAVDLERSEPSGPRSANASEHCLEAAGNPGDPLEGWRIHGIHAHRYTVEARGLERCGQLVQKVTVGGQCGSSGSPVIVCKPDSSLTSSTSPRRSSGSPPVRRTFVMPRPTNTLIRRRYSSIPSSGYCAPISPVRQ